MAAATMLRERIAATHRPKARSHICFVAPYAWPVISADPRIAEVGGAEMQQSILARLFAANGYRVSMICLDYGQPERTLIDGVTVHKSFAPQAGVPVLRFLHPRLTTLWRLLAEVDADIYYCRAAGMQLGIVSEFCRRHGKRSVYAGASDMDFVAALGDKIRYARDRWLYRRGLARVDAIVAQNELQRASCRATYGREALVIPSCYALPSDAAREPGSDRVLWVGMIRAGKRPELFVELARRLHERRFVMIGGAGRNEAALFERMRAEAAALPNMEFTGFLPLAEVERRFDGARLLVNTSHYEGMPNTFLQAWARGIPTLGTVDVGASVHSPFRDLDEGARQIEALLASDTDWERASRRCREYFERTHSGAETLERYARLFDELTA
jgi:glycosyltransferase involved in cell wall biosynthesis